MAKHICALVLYDCVRNMDHESEINNYYHYNISNEILRMAGNLVEFISETNDV